MNANTDTMTATEFSVTSFVTKGTYSPYGVIKVANEVLAALEIDKVLPGPMGYTYCKKGYIATIDEAKKVVARADAIEWIEKYVTKLVAKAQIVEEVTEEAAEMTEEIEFPNE